MIWRRDKSLAERENMRHRGSSDSRATADSHCAAQGSRNEMEMSRQRSCRDVLLIWLVKLQERVKRVDTFVRDTPPITERRHGVIGKMRNKDSLGSFIIALRSSKNLRAGRGFVKKSARFLSVST